MKELNEIIRTKEKEIENLYKGQALLRQKSQEMHATTCIDEERSVRWNREEIERRRKDIDDKIAQTNTKIGACTADINQAIIEYIMQEYHMNEKQAQFLFNSAYEDSHSAGYYAVAERTDELAKLVDEYTRMYRNT